LKTEVGQNSIYAARANAKIILAELLCNHFGGNVRVQESIAHHLRNYFLRTTIVAFGPAAMAYESGSTMFMEEGSELEVALTAETKLLSHTGRTIRAAFSFDNHSQFSSNFIVGVDRQKAMRSNKRIGCDLIDHKGAS
jgi:hypothetical protein